MNAIYRTRWSKLECVLCAGLPIPVDGERYTVCSSPAHLEHPHVKQYSKTSCAEHPGAKVARWMLQRRKAGNYVQCICERCQQEKEEKAREMKNRPHPSQLGLNALQQERQERAALIVSCDEAVGNAPSSEEEYQRLLAQVQDPELRKVIEEGRANMLAGNSSMTIAHVPAIIVKPAPPMAEPVSNNVGSEALTPEPSPDITPEKASTRDPAVTRGVMSKAREIAHRLADEQGMVSARQIYEVMLRYGHPGLVEKDRSSVGGVFRGGWVRIGWDKVGGMPAWAPPITSRKSKA